MIETTRDFLTRHAIDGRARFIVAVSGGADSIALLDAFASLGREPLALHCNFALRGEESDGDERFVRRFCEARGIPLVTRRFDTAAIARERRASVEVTARDLRRAWFEETRRERGLDYIALGHHADDQAETLLANLCRGTGVRGLAGMKPVNGRLLRPFLERSRAEIEASLAARGIDFRVDSSNASLEYTRNRIRHRLLPACREINPAFTRAAVETCRALEETRRIFLHGVEQLKKEVLVEDGDDLLVLAGPLLASPAPFTLLFEILRPRGFNAARVRDILRDVNAPTGKRFPAGDYLLARERDGWRLSAARAGDDPRVTLDGPGEYRVGDRLLHLVEREVDGDFRIPAGGEVACLDLSRLAYPLLARRWREGDRFRPLGMTRGSKKLSDFFVDRAFNNRQKRECLLLLSGEQVAWVVGHRLDDRFKITPGTRRALVITVSGPRNRAGV